MKWKIGVCILSVFNNIIRGYKNLRSYINATNRMKQKTYDDDDF